jgi:hypothetical protein
MPGQLSGLGFSNHNVVRGPAKGCQHAVTRASALRGKTVERGLSPEGPPISGVILHPACASVMLSLFLN